MNCSFSFTTRGCKRIDNQVQLILSCSVTHTSHQWIDLFLSLSKQKRKFSVSTMFMGSGFSRPWETDIPQKSKNNPPKKTTNSSERNEKTVLILCKKGFKSPTTIYDEMQRRCVHCFQPAFSLKQRDNIWWQQRGTICWLNARDLRIERNGEGIYRLHTWWNSLVWLSVIYEPLKWILNLLLVKNVHSLLTKFFSLITWFYKITTFSKRGSDVKIFIKIKISLIQW